ncbi:SCO2322 family protein [Streptomyces sp. 71268]|uniref:SCO2322 family protein n=1 Tax=Streptomyces sp. 71268 TaxID=3002640 RepID=UPI0023F8C2CD|nr:SCO2322 family protein [Streptomyces sp. 71268]WEV28103.1 SCO2322 family protein [Streptomyces sp. 71268]
MRAGEATEQAATGPARHGATAARRTRSARPAAGARSRRSAGPRTRRGSLATPVALALAAPLLGLWGAAPAAADGYRYWSFWERDGGEWTYATQGPATARPGDGDTIGFRFAVSQNTRDAARPRGAADFAAICAGTPDGGGKRVAVVLDFGTARDAPGGDRPPRSRTACARVGDDGTAADALAQVAKPLRYDSTALLCAIAGYPRSGCGEQVGDSADSPGTGETAREDTGRDATAKDGADDSGPSAGLIGGAVAIAALGAAALWQARRRRG